MSDQLSGENSQASFEEMSEDESEISFEEVQEEKSQSSVEITIGHNNLRIEGSENFISKELSTILDRINLGMQPQIGNKVGAHETKPIEEEPSENGASAPTETVEDAEEGADTGSDLAEVANRINVSPDVLAEHFYIDNEEIHIQNPMSIDPRFALLGYCTIREELTGDTYHDNTGTKKKLIDAEKVDIEEWGGTLLYRLRQGGYIKDDPNSQRSRNKPFKITPSGRKKLVEWLNEDD